MTAWDLAAICYGVALAVWSLRVGWRYNPQAPVWARLLNARAAVAEPLTWLFIAGLVVSLFMGFDDSGIRTQR